MSSKACWLIKPLCSVLFLLLKTLQVSGQECNLPRNTYKPPKRLTQYQILTKSFSDSTYLDPYAHEDCNVSIDENRIKNNLNLDYFLKRIQTDSFSLCTEKQRIPEYIHDKIDCLFGDFANVGEDWNGTCTVTEDLPFKQLQFFAINKQKDIMVLVYRSGTIGVATSIVFMRLASKGISVNSQKQVVDIWGCRSFFHGKTLPELVTYIQKHRTDIYLSNSQGVDF